MDFFKLLHTAGFVKKEKSKDLKAQQNTVIVPNLTSGRPAIGGTQGELLPNVAQLDENKDRPWRLPKLKQLNEELEFMSSSEDEGQN